MNPFERLRQTIDKVSIAYQYSEEPQPIPENDNPTQTIRAPQIIQNQNNQVKKIREVCENQQSNHLKQIAALSGKVEQLAKALKRAEALIETHMNDIVALQKQNEQLKDNLNAQYSGLVQTDQKQRKYKQEIYRINLTVNELAIEINSQRNAKKQIIKDLQTTKAEVNKKDKQIVDLKAKYQAQIQQIKSELEERIQMFEYNVKKNSEDRKDYRLNVSKMQQNFDKTVESYRQQIDRVKQQLFEARKEVEIITIRKENLQKSYQNLNRELEENKIKNINLNEEMQELKNKYQGTIKSHSSLEQSMRSLGSQLAEERKNVKVKVIEVKDKTIQMQLDMYKRQCKQLMQQKAIMTSLNQPERIIEPGYKIISSQLSQNK